MLNMILFFAHFFDIDEIVKKNFESLGVNVLVDFVKNADTLLEKLKKGTYEIVFIKDGNDLSQASEILKQIQKISPAMPVVFVVENVNKELAEALIQDGAVDIITEKEFFSPTLTNTYFKAIKKSSMKKEENRLREIIERGQKFWFTVFDSVPELAFVIDEHENIVKCNKPFANLFEKHPRDLENKKISELLSLTMFQKIDIDNLPQYFDEELNGRSYAITSAMFEFEGKKNIVFFMRDVTEVKKMREHLIQKDRYTSIGTLSSGIAHEINNPLTGIIGFAQMLKMVDGCKQSTELIDKILECADRCKKIVESLLIYARQKPSTKSLESINDLIERTIDLVGYNLKKNNICVEKELSNIPVAFIDGQQLQQAIINMIINAQDAIISAKRDKGVIRIKTEFEEKGKMIFINISDNGKGISKEIIGKIFDPFFKSKPFGEAMGLGLSIAYGIVKGHNGDILVETKEGVGTTFVIKLPLEI